MDRTRQAFPTRLYPHRRSGQAGPPGLAADAEREMSLPAGVYRFRLGRDQRPEPMTPAEITAQLKDPFAGLLLSRGILPLSLRSLLAALDAHNAAAEGLPEQHTFLAADGGKIPWTPETDDLRREFRFIVTRGRPGQQPPDLMIAASTVVDSEEIFLQLISWDPLHEVYHFYERLGQGWGWAGNSWDALAPDTRGKGPFDSHVSGAMVMKELKAPWIHWHSQASSITADALSPTDSLRAEPLFLQRIGAEFLERDVVRPGIRRWNEARFRKCFQGGVLHRAPEFLRQVLETTTVNLTSAPEDRSQLLPGRAVHLPLSFFFNDEALLNLLRLPAVLQRPELDAAIYARSLQEHAVAIGEGDFVFPGDTHFLFLVPEPAFEDHIVLQKLVRLGLLPPKLAAALLMVDFANPVFSARRASLVRHVPGKIRLDAGANDLGDLLVDSINAAGAPAGSAEEEFLANLAMSDTEWPGVLARRIEDYMSRVHPALQSFHTFDPLFRLAESRRREFRRRPLFEFDLTTPTTNIPADAPLLEMTLEATVRAK